MSDAHLLTARELTTHQYAIVDRMRLPVTMPALPLIDLVPPLATSQAGLYPGLLLLRELTANQWHTLLQEARAAHNPKAPPLLTLLLASELAPEEIKGLLIKALIFTDARQRRYLLRYYDPEVLFQLQWMLSSWELSERLQTEAIPYWTFWLEGHWQTLACHAVMPVTPAASPVTLEQLQQIGLINRLLTLLPPTHDNLKRQQNSRHIAALLQTARQQFGLQDKQDLLAFAGHGLTIHPQFYLHPAITALITHKLSPGDYDLITQRWTHERWQQIVREIKEGTLIRSSL